MPNTINEHTAETQQVMDHHLGAFAKGLDEILKDYNEGSTLLTPEKNYSGLAEIRGFFQAFIDNADPAFWPAFKIIKLTVEGQVGYLAWEAKPWVGMATDTLLVQNGRIVTQTFTSLSA